MVCAVCEIRNKHRRLVHGGLGEGEHAGRASVSQGAFPTTREVKTMADRLCEQFTDPQFRQLVGKIAPTLVHDLFGEVPLARLISEGLELLRRHGRLDVAFFVAWQHERPAQRETIATLALHFGFELPPPPADAAASAEAGTSNSEPKLPELSNQDIIQIIGVPMFGHVLYCERDSDNVVLTGLGAFLLCVLLPGRFGREGGAVEPSVTLIVGAGLVGVEKFLDSQRRPDPAHQPEPSAPTPPGRRVTFSDPRHGPWPGDIPRGRKPPGPSSASVAATRNHEPS